MEEDWPMYREYYTDMNTWLNKTGFPDTWPVTNTDRQVASYSTSSR